MASADQIAELRRKISEPDTTTYSDADLNTRIDEANGDVNGVAGVIWQEKASQYSEMVDISEAGSSRKNSQLMKNALEMASFYAGNSTDSAADTADRPRTRAIVRA